MTQKILVITLIARIFCLPYGILSLRSSDFVDDEPHGFSRQDSSAIFVADSSLKRGYFKDNSSIFYVSSLKLVDFKDERCMAAEAKVQLGKLHVTWPAAEPAQAINASTACERNCLNSHKRSLKSLILTDFGYRL